MSCLNLGGVTQQPRCLAAQNKDVATAAGTLEVPRPGPVKREEENKPVSFQYELCGCEAHACHMSMGCI